MASESEKPRVTEIQVRMDCNGCLQKIKKALHSINGIYDLYIDFPNQKLTIVGWADPERIVKAIRKTRKTATICSPTEQTEPSNQPTEQAKAEGGAPPPNDAVANPPPPPDGPPAEPPQPAEPPKDQPPPENPPPAAENPPPPLETPQPVVKPSPVAADANSNQQAAGPSRPKDVGQVHVIHHHPPDYNYGYGNGHSRHWEAAPQGPQPVYVTHSYNTYKPAPYVTEHEYVRPPTPRYTNYSRMDHYSDEYHGNYHNHHVYYNTSDGNGNGNGNITSIFSDENPNACSVM